MDYDLQTSSKPTADSPSWWSRITKGLFIGLPTAIIGLFVVATPPGLLEKAKLMGYALCHQMPDRSFFFHEHQSPLCARCTGMYIGVLLGVLSLILRRRTRSARPPTTPIISMLVGFMTIMLIDGVNSTISIIPGAPQLYHTTNLHRLVTGTLFGLALSMLFIPIFNTAIWTQPSGERTIKNWRELFILIIAAFAFDALVLTQADWLLYPITILSIVGPMFMLGFMGAVIVLTTRNLVNMIDRWRQLALPLLAGLAFGVVLITLMDILRVAVTTGV